MDIKKCQCGNLWCNMFVYNDSIVLNKFQAYEKAKQINEYLFSDVFCTKEEVEEFDRLIKLLKH